MILIRSAFAFLLSLALSGCFDDLSSSNTQASVGKYLVAEDFSGAEYAQNILTGIKIGWTAGSTDKKIVGYRIYRYELNTPQIIASVDASTTSFVDGHVTSGTLYFYLVKAVDPSGEEDPNTHKVSTLAWAGLTNVVSKTNDSLTATFDPKIQGVFMKLYLSGDGRSKTQVAVLNSSAQLSSGTVTLSQWPDGTSLKPGSAYSLYAELYEDGGTHPDGNTHPYLVTTKSYGYEDSGSGAPGWNNIAALRAFGRSPGTLGSAQDTALIATAPHFIPTTLAQVDIGFRPFTLPVGFSTSLYRYVVLRAGESVALDTSNRAIGTCPSSYSPSASQALCIVRDNIHPVSDVEDGLVVAHDTSVWTSGSLTSEKPPRYRYTMAIKHLDTANGMQGYIEALPLSQSNQFSVLVPIPPNDMVLINREAVNFEMCAIQKSVTSDPLNHNRCASFEVGSSPYDSGPGSSPLHLDFGYYDFGYNLFVDRYPLACRNSSQAEEALAGGAARWTSSTAAPTTAGSVLFTAFTTGATANLRMSNCLYNSGTAWTDLASVQSTSGILSPAVFQATLTNSPYSGSAYAKRPKFSYPAWDTVTANLACESFNETGYGSKRIPRMREYRAMAAPPFSKRLSDGQVIDMYYTPISAALAASGSNWTSGSCVKGNVISSSAWPTPPATISAAFSASNINNLSYSAAAGPPGFFIGARGNSDCVSRYGVSDIDETPSMNATYFNLLSINTAWYPVSDIFLWTMTTNISTGTLRGLASSVDSGNTDASFDITTGLPSGYIMNVSSQTQTTAASDRFNIALGLPVLSTQTGVNAYGQNRATADNYGQSILTVFPSGATTAYYARASARWSSSFQDGKSYNSRVRCVLSAE